MDDNFIRLYNKYFLDVYRLSYSYLLNSQEAEDITQNTFIKLYDHSEILNQNDQDILKWLFRVAINNSKNNLFSIWYKKRVQVDDLDNNYNYNYNSKSNNLRLSLIELPSKYRIPIHLYYYDGYSIKEISSIMRIKESTVKSRLLRSKKILKIEMEGDI